MAYRLRDEVAYCLVGGRAIFLDLRRNRYFALGSEQDAAFRSLLDGNPDDRRLGALVEQGLLVVAAGAAELTPRENLSTAENSILDRPSPRLRPGAMWAVSRALAETAILLRMKGLSQIIAHVRARKARIAATGDPVDHIAALAHALEVTRGLVSSHDRCLLRSIALTRSLQRRDIAADLVFGVTTRPFRAHCWVERQGLILNDRFEHVRTYTPILII